MEVGAFVFDLDGTLVETEELKGLSYARAAVELRGDLLEADVLAAFEDLVGRSRREVATTLMQRFELEDAARSRAPEFGTVEPWEAYVGLRLRVYEGLLRDPKVLLDHRYPQTISLLREVRGEGYPTALSTTSHLEQAGRVLSVLGLTDAFDAIVTGDDVERSKPDPAMDLLAASELGVDPGACIVIEDSPVGVEGAINAGMEVVAVPTRLTRNKFQNSDLLDDDHVVYDPRDLSSVVRRLVRDRE